MNVYFMLPLNISILFLLITQKHYTVTGMVCKSFLTWQDHLHRIKRRVGENIVMQRASITKGNGKYEYGLVICMDEFTQ